MRILAIRGRNLASLAGDFEVGLEEGPLRSAGLFALTGPTGAGKSTILDALCLALFDTTPRLRKSARALIGRPEEDEGARLAASDVRSLLRRGAAAGFAEAEFRGRDGRRYRARWSVRRARDRADGRLQTQTVELRDLDTGLSLGGTKTETLSAIEERLGLSFDQFRRSALLAQGDFAEFLKADERDRSELLERITGAEIYTEVSRLAYRRAQEEQSALAEMARDLEAVSILDLEPRAALEAELGRFAGEIGSAEARLAEAQRASEWYRVLSDLDAGAAEAERGKAEAEAAWDGAGPLQVELRAVEAAQPLRSRVEALDGAREALRRAEAEVGRLESSAAATAAEACYAADAQVEAGEAADRAEAALSGARPALAEAADLDARIGEAQTKASTAREARKAAERGAHEARGLLAELAAELSAADAARQQSEAWLSHRHDLHDLAAEWGRWRRELERLAGAAARVAEIERALPGAARKAEKTARGAALAAERLQALEGRVRSAAEAAQEAESAASDLDPAGLRRERVLLEARRERVRELLLLAGQARETQEARDAAAQAVLSSTAEADAAARRGEEAMARIAALAGALPEAEQALERARLAEDLAAHRAVLRDGEPCPLCGSASHPWAALPAPFSVLTRSQEERVRTLRRETDACGREEAAARQTEALGRRAASEAEARSAEASESLDALARRWAARRAELEDRAVPPSPTAPDAALVLEEGLASAQEGLAALRQAEENAAALAGRAASLRRELDQARAERDRAQSDALAAERTAQAAARDLSDLDRTLEQAQEERTRGLVELAPVLPAGDREALARDPARFAAAWGAEVEAWNERVAARDEAARCSGELAPRVSAARTALAERERVLSERAREAGEADEALGALRARRSGLLGGRPASEVEGELRRAAEAARAAQEAARREREERQGRAVAAAARLETGRMAAQEANVREGEARRGLSTALAERGLEEDTLRALLERTEAWVGRRRLEIESLRKRRERAVAVLEERRRGRDAHAARGRPALSEAEAPSQASALGAELSRLREEHFRVRRALQNDDAARLRRRELEPRVAAQQARTDLWKSLSDLIGSADGKKFRSYAQSLTLEVLLSHANEHLKDLAPRYRLARVPGQDLEIQVVDLDMGEEVRSVASLSGGESFLVSLALALGLSSLSTRTTRVESLFIDEGFGSLDPETLDTALAALDALQASGRKIGVISHVPGLAERIGAQVKVTPQGSGRSRVEVVGAGQCTAQIST